MRINRQMAGVLAIVALAFVAGRMDWFCGLGSAASAQEKPDQTELKPEVESELKGETEMDPETLAWIEVGTPGEHHKHLDTLVGEWEAVYTIWMDPDEEPIVSRGTIVRKWVLDGRFLHEVVEAQSDWGPYKGFGYIGYNNQDGRYEAIWMDTMSTAIYSETGNYNPEAKILKMRGGYRNALTGRYVATHGEMHLSDPDRHVYIGYAIDAEGKEYKSVEGIAERKKK